MKFVCYSDWNQLPASANALFEQGEKDSIFFSRLWFECLTTTALDDDHTLVLACVVAGDTVMAILPLMESAGNKAWYSLRHGFTPLYSLLLADHDQERVLSCLARALSQLPVKGLLLEPVADDDSKINGLQRVLETAGFSCDYIFRSYNWIYRLQGQSYAEYMAERPAHLRNTISRKKRKLDREHGYEIRLFIGDEVPRHMSDYYVVYNASWKQNEIKNAGFQDCFVESFSKAGWSRLAILYVKGQPVAAQLWFVHHGKASIFRLAYDKAWRQYSTGSILTSFLMEYVIDTDAVEVIDFLTGNDAYKQDWMSERRERFVLGCIKSVRSASRYERFVGSLQRMLKRR
jgi:ribosomal protein S18 acetylase RimI-like enzyme